MLLLLRAELLQAVLAQSLLQVGLVQRQARRLRQPAWVQEDRGEAQHQELVWLLSLPPQLLLVPLLVWVPLPLSPPSPLLLLSRLLLLLPLLPPSPLLLLSLPLLPWPAAPALSPAAGPQQCPGAAGPVSEWLSAQKSAWGRSGYHRSSTWPAVGS